MPETKLAPVGRKAEAKRTVQECLAVQNLVTASVRFVVIRDKDAHKGGVSQRSRDVDAEQRALGEAFDEGNATMMSNESMMTVLADDEDENIDSDLLLDEESTSFMIQRDNGHAVFVEVLGEVGILQGEGGDGADIASRPIAALMLHGEGGPGASAADAAALCREAGCPRDYMVVVPHLRGCGRSRPSGRTSHNLAADAVSDVEAVRQRLGLQKW